MRVESGYALSPMSDPTRDDKDESATEASDADAGDEQSAEDAKARAAEHTRQAAKRAADAIKADQAKKQQKNKRQWYHWVIDITLFGLTAYLIWTRFIAPKQNMVPADQPPPPQSTSSAPAPAPSALPPRVLVNPTRLLQGPGYQFAVIENLSAPVRAEALESPQNGWIKVRIAPNKIGWVTVDAVSDPMQRDR